MRVRQSMPVGRRVCSPTGLSVIDAAGKPMEFFSSRPTRLLGWSFLAAF